MPIRLALMKININNLIKKKAFVSKVIDGDSFELHHVLHIVAWTMVSHAEVIRMITV